jgi:2-iminobutanoate/2-iminopropanoate deaminase
MSHASPSRVAFGALCAVASMTLLLSLTAETASAQSPPSPVQYLRHRNSRAPFSPAVRVGDILYLSGQIGARPDGHLPATFAEQTRQALENIKRTLTEAGSSFDEVFKCTVMLTDMSHWEEFNKIYVTYFAPDKLPARSAIGANALALGAMVELECTAYSPPPRNPRPQ